MSDAIREAFEAYVSDQPGFTRSELSKKNGEYADAYTASVWIGWQAALQQTAPAVPEVLRQTMSNLIDFAWRQVCTHEETHRGGAIWEICNSCGAKWADDEGGKPEFVTPEAIERAEALLAALQSQTAPAVP